MAIQIVLLRTHDGRVYHKHPDGFPTGLVVPNSHALFENLGLIIDKLRNANPDNLKNVYYTLAHHTGLGGNMPERSKLSFQSQSVLAFDLDHVDLNRQWDYLPVVAKILGVSPQSLAFVSTGNGLHILAHLKTPIRSNKYLEETKPNYNELVYQINKALLELGLPGQADPSIWDAPRILRLPNTINEKKGVTKESRLLQYPGLLPLDLDIIKLSGLDAVAAANISPAQLKKNYPRPDFNQVMTQCEFMKWLVASPEQVHEPQFQNALGLFGAMSPGDKFLDADTERSPKETAEKVFNAACNSASLARGDFERKWEHGIRYGAPKCSTVSAQWIGGCEKCPHFNKINTPLALKSEDHISSSGSGYWVIGKNNNPVHPHYSDLAKIYTRDHSYISCEPDRLFTFDKTHYQQTGQLTVKAWVQRKVGYEEHLREAHCIEFVKRILRSQVLSEADEKALFEGSVKGKLNCSNGVVDVATGEISPSTASVGFKYVLPYDFIPGQASEYFLDWLSEMMLHRTELMDAVLDMMAYCLLPGYDDHVFAYLIGEGANGKGTLIHIMQQLVGSMNYSAISLSQLGGNRFAAANLEGKLLNLSEESSGNDLSFEQLNIIKDLSAGGEMQVERKGQHPFKLKNSAKMIFSANKAPRFHESGHAIRRRLLVIPFDHKIEEPDASVEPRLFSEIPKICSMLVTRIQENLKSNAGHFRVSRGGATSAVAQDKLLLSGNSVVEWGKVCLDSDASYPEEKYITCQESYQRYSSWCQENNFKAVNSTNFGYTMTHGVLTGAVKTSKIIKVGTKTSRVYPRTQWKDEII